MSFDDPNREAVGLAPIWTGAGEGPEVDPEKSKGKAGAFDPADHTAEDVKAYVEAHPDTREDVLDAELDGKNRTTLIDWLEEA